MSCVEQTKGKYVAKNPDGSFKRKEPPYPENECCGEIKKGNDGLMYKNVLNKMGDCIWKKMIVWPATDKKVRAGSYLRKILDILRSEDRWFFYYSRDVDQKKQKEGKLPDMNLPPGIGEKILEYNEADTKLDDIGPSVYVVVGLKRGIKLGLIEKLETPGEKRLYMGHRYKAVGVHIAPCEDKNKERNRNGRCVDRKVWTKVTEKEEYGGDEYSYYQRGKQWYRLYAHGREMKSRQPKILRKEFRGRVQRIVRDGKVIYEASEPKKKSPKKKPAKKKSPKKKPAKKKSPKKKPAKKKSPKKKPAKKKSPKK